MRTMFSMIMMMIIIIMLTIMLIPHLHMWMTIKDYDDNGNDVTLTQVKRLKGRVARTRRNENPVRIREARPGLSGSSSGDFDDF